MRDHMLETAGVGVENPVFDVQAVNKYLRRLNAYLDGSLMGRNDAFDVQRTTDAPGEQAFEEYVGKAIESMLSDYSMDEDDAVEVLADVVSEAEAMGLLPPYPDAVDTVPDQMYSDWVAAAQSISLGAMMRKYAEDGSINGIR